MLKNQSEIPSVPLLAHRGFFCFRCWEPSPKMTKCAGCRRTYYCSKPCQKRDWDVQHKKHCKMLRQINAMEEGETAKSRSWESWQSLLFQKLKYMKSASPDALPWEIVQGQPYCSTCYRSGIQAAAMGTTLTPCAHCHMVFSCSDCKLSHPKEQCLEYQSRGQVENERIMHFEQSGQAHCRAPMDAPRSDYRALSSASNWIEYLAKISDKDFLQMFTGQEINLLNHHAWKFPEQFTHSAREDVQRVLMYNLLATDTLTMPVSIVAALEDSPGSLISQETLSIHLIGADTKEHLNLMMFEEILHLLPSLRHLKITLIGPAKVDSPDDKLSEEMQCNVCAKCAETGRTRTATLYKGLYHDFAQNPQYRKPDLAVLFHSGRTQAAEESWRPTTQFLVASGILTLCTTYNLGEATEEAAELDLLGARFVVRPEVNKWKSLVPLPDFNDGPEHAIYYHNFYRYVFQGSG
jgi:splicing suppressor protein 51